MRRPQFTMRWLFGVMFFAAMACYWYGIERPLRQARHDLEMANARWMTLLEDSEAVCSASQRLCQAECRSLFHDDAVSREIHLRRLRELESSLAAGIEVDLYMANPAAGEQAMRTVRMHIASASRDHESQ